MIDTPAAVANMVRERLLARSGAERFLMGIAAFETARAFVEASLPPALGREERRQLLYRRIYGEEPPWCRKR